MNEHPSNKSEKTEAGKLVGELMPVFSEKICLHFDVELDNAGVLKNNFFVKSELSGHNNQICLIDFFDAQKRYIGESCLKYSIKEEKDYLQIESKILDLLYSNNILCPVIIDTGSRNDFSYILMETIKGDCLSNKIIDIKIANLVFDAIHQHESVLLDNIEILKQLGLFSDLSKEIDFESKLVNFLQKFMPNFTIKKQLDFLNHHLNQPDVIAKRRIITDRSAENIFIDENNQLIMIDFSTVRIGTR